MKRNRTEPMLVYYPMALPHRPMVPTPTPKNGRNRPERREHTLFADMIAYMDKTVVA